MAVSLIVCSLPVLVPLILRFCGHNRGFKGSTTQGNSQSFGMSKTSGKRTRSAQLESIGNFAPHLEYTVGRVTVISAPQSSLPPIDPSKVYGKEPLYSHNSSVGGNHYDSKHTLSAPFVYSSKVEEEAARRGWAKGMKVAREVIANMPLDGDQYAHQAKTVARHTQRPTSRPTRTDLEDYWGPGIQAIRDEDTSHP